MSYVQTLLLGLANPYGLLTGQLSRTVALLAEHSSLAELTATPPTATDTDTAFLAVIYAHTDQAPLPWAKLAVADEADTFYLHTELLVNELRRQLAEVGNSPSPTLGSEEEFQRVQRIDFLHRLERAWQLVAHRELPPPARDRVFIVSNGFTPVWQYLHADSATLPRASDAQLQVTSTCSLISETSDNGYVLRQVRAAPRPIRVGELLALRETADEAWRIAVVRWFRNTLQHQTLELGCELLAHGGEAVTVLVDEAGRHYTQPSLLLGGESDPAGPSSLLARPHTLSAYRSALMRRGDATIPIKIGALREQSANFAQFEVAYA
jgi:ribosomal protein S28E/S33